MPDNLHFILRRALRVRCCYLPFCKGRKGIQPRVTESGFESGVADSEVSDTPDWKEPDTEPSASVLRMETSTDAPQLRMRLRPNEPTII